MPTLCALLPTPPCESECRFALHKASENGIRRASERHVARHRGRGCSETCSIHTLGCLLSASRGTYDVALVADAVDLELPWFSH